MWDSSSKGAEGEKNNDENIHDVWCYLLHSDMCVNFTSCLDGERKDQLDSNGGLKNNNKKVFEEHGTHVLA